MLRSLMHSMSRLGLSMVIWTKKEEGSKDFLKKEDTVCCKRKMIYKTKNNPSTQSIENCLKMAG